MPSVRLTCSPWQHLTLLQLSPTDAVAPSADLVAWSRLGSAYSRAELESALQGHALLELDGMVRPSEDLALYRADMAEWPSWGQLRDWQVYLRDWVRSNDECRLNILGRLGSAGPLPLRDLPDTCKVPWQSTGWTDNRNVSRLLDFMVQRGEVAVARRQRGERVWDLAARVYPDDPVVPADEAWRIRNELRLRALGIARSRGPECPVEPQDVGEAGEPAVVEGVRARGVSTQPCWDSHSPGVRRCCHRSTGWSASSTPRRIARPEFSGSPRSMKTCRSTSP
jgi:hypothetical protein